MEQKFQCDRCGKEFTKKYMTFISCEGLFCVPCADDIYMKEWENFASPFQFEDNGINEFKAV
jgi:hypothetical protein